MLLYLQEFPDLISQVVFGCSLFCSGHFSPLQKSFSFFYYFTAIMTILNENNIYLSELTGQSLSMLAKYDFYDFSQGRKSNIKYGTAAQVTVQELYSASYHKSPADLRPSRTVLPHHKSAPHSPMALPVLLR